MTNQAPESPADDFPVMQICHDVEDYGDELAGEEVRSDLDDEDEEGEEA